MCRESKGHCLRLPVLLALLSWSSPVWAQESQLTTDEGTEGPNIVEFFLGNTRSETPSGHENALSVGAAYHYLINPSVSIGILGEYASDPMDTWVLGTPIILRVGEGWQFTAMPGVEREHGDSNFLFRAGVGYEFELKGYSLKPEVNADFVDGDVSIITGLSIGFRF